MKKLRYVSGAFALFLIALVIGIYIGGQLSYAQEAEEELKWYPDFGGKVMDKVRSLRTENGETAGWRIPTKEMLYQVNMHLVKGEMEMHFILTDKEHSVLETSGYRLFVRGYDPEGDASWCEDIPPIIKWP